MRHLRSVVLFAWCAAAAFAQSGPLNIVGGVIDFSGAGHVAPLKVVADVASLPSSGCTAGELAIVSAASPGQQIYENSGAGTCIWSQQTAPSQPPVSPGYSGNGLISGGGVVWAGGLSYTVSAASYLIASNQYNSPLTTVTSDAADAQDRIDLIALDTSNAVVIIKGTASATPAQPSIDASTQLALTFVYIPGSATQPSNLATTLLYDEDTGGPGEWNATNSGAGFNLASTNNPYHGTKDVEATAVTTGNYVQLQKPSGTLDLSTQNLLAFYIRSKAAWPSKRSLTIYFANAGTQVGTAVNFAQGSFAFDSSITASYQQIVIPVSVFGTASQAVNQLVFKVGGSGGTIGFYLDYVQLQSGISQSGSTSSMNWRGAWSSSTAYSVNDVVTNANASWIALQANTNVTPVAGANWAQVAVYAPVQNSQLANSSTTVNSVTCTLGSSCTITSAALGLDILSSPAVSGGTKSTYKTEYQTITAGNSVDILPVVSGAGYVDHIFIVADKYNVQVNVFVDGEGSPSISALISDLCGDHYSDTQPAFVTKWLISTRFVSAAHPACGFYIPIPFSTSIKVQAKNTEASASTSIASMVSCRTGIANTWPYTRHLKLAIGSASGVAANGVTTMLDVSSLNQGRLAFIGWTYDGFPGTANPRTAPLEGNFKIYIDGSGTPLLESSGSEDLFDMAFYFAGFTAGTSVSEQSVLTVKTADTFGGVRMFLTDPIYFSNALKATWQCGDTTEVAFTGTCTVFWTIGYYTE